MIFDLNIMWITHESEGVFVDEGSDVGGPLAYDLLNQGSDDGVDLGLEIVSHFFTLFFH